MSFVARLEKFLSAVRETGVSRHNGGPIKPPNTIESTVVVPLNCPPHLCRERPVSRTAIRVFGFGFVFPRCGLSRLECWQRFVPDHSLHNIWKMVAGELKTFSKQMPPDWSIAMCVWNNNAAIGRAGRGGRGLSRRQPMGGGETVPVGR